MNYDGICNQAQENIQIEEKKIDDFLIHVESTLKAEAGYNRKTNNFLNSLTESITGFSLFVFLEDSLCYWSDNSVQITKSQIQNIKNHESVLLKNGWYELFKRRAGDKLIVALFLIKHEYSIENKYLVNDFNKVLNVPAQTKISQVKDENIFPVHSSSGEVLFSLSFTSGEAIENNALGMVYMIAIFSLILFFYLFIRQQFLKNPLSALFIIVLTVTLRILMVVYRFPAALYDMSLFSPKFYASSYMLNSLGDLLVSSVIFCFIITSIYYYYEKHESNLKNPINKITSSVRVIIIWLFIFLFSVLVNYLLSSLILNSKISFNINNIFELTGYSIVGFLVIGILLFSFYLVCDGGLRFILKTNFSFRTVAVLFLITQGIFLVLLIKYRQTELFGSYGVSSFLLANLLILFIAYIRKTSGRAFSFSRSILFILGFSVYAAQNIYEFNLAREKNSRSAFAVKLENEQDNIAEYLFDEIASRMRSDKIIESYLSSSNMQLLSGNTGSEALNKRIKVQYFSGYWKKFNVDVKVLIHKAFRLIQAETQAGILIGLKKKLIITVSLHIARGFTI